MSKAAECSLLPHNKRDINWRQQKCQMMWKQTKSPASFCQDRSRADALAVRPQSFQHPQPGSALLGLAPPRAANPKSHTQDCALLGPAHCHTSVPAASAHRAGMCGVGSRYRTDWIFSKGYYLKKTLLYAWANMVNCTQLAQGKVRHILKQRKAISGRCIQFREIYYPQRNIRKKKSLFILFLHIPLRVTLVHSWYGIEQCFQAKSSQSFLKWDIVCLNNHFLESADLIPCFSIWGLQKKWHPSSLL